MSQKENAPGAVGSMVCGIIGICACLVHALVGIPAVICGHMALSSFNSTTSAVEGRGMAIVGLVTGYIAIAMQFFWIILMFIGEG